MASAIGALHDGFDYQSHLFWEYACCLFEPSTHVTTVAIEEHSTKAFDDVVVTYDAGKLDRDGTPVLADHFQAKFHRWPREYVTWQDLIDPAFINADRYSLLERARDAYRQHADNRRFILYSPWLVDPKDPLLSKVSNSDERLHLDGAARPRSARGRAQQQLMQHLRMAVEQELLAILRTLRFQQCPSLEAPTRRLNARLRAAGLVPLDAGRLSNPYDELTRRIIRLERRTFSRIDIEQLCKREGLWTGYTLPEEGAIRLGVRSFARHAERLAEETDRLLDLLPHFDGRHPRHPADWTEVIFPALEQFLAQCQRDQRYLLHLHAHGSIAFACGYCLDPKTGINAVPVQNTRGQAIWRPALRPDPTAYPAFTVEEYRRDSVGRDVALAIGVTHNVSSDVSLYVERQLPQVERIVSFILPDGCGSEAVHDATHAHLLAAQIARFCHEQRSVEERKGTLHLFAAAPGGLLYFLGQHARVLGRCCLYEYNFGQNDPGGYAPSLTLPLECQT